MKLFLEACCSSAADAYEAEQKGAQRIELCERLDVGGVTPSPPNIVAVLKKWAQIKSSV